MTVMKSIIMYAMENDPSYVHTFYTILKNSLSTEVTAKDIYIMPHDVSGTLCRHAAYKPWIYDMSVGIVCTANFQRIVMRTHVDSPQS
jgi:hypothetical protein